MNLTFQQQAVFSDYPATFAELDTQELSEVFGSRKGISLESAYLVVSSVSMAYDFLRNFCSDWCSGWWNAD